MISPELGAQPGLPCLLPGAPLLRAMFGFGKPNAPTYEAGAKALENIILATDSYKVSHYRQCARIHAAENLPDNL